MNDDGLEEDPQRGHYCKSVESRTNTFFTLVNGKRADVGVVDGPNGKYVRIHADGYYNDNLLAPVECVAA
jgi:Protein of unknown function (DUF3892)